jgi:excisionase family DNA binding protein
MQPRLGYLIRMTGTTSNEQITWWLIDQICDYLGMNEDQIGRLVRLHGLPHRDFGGLRRYPKGLVEAWAEQDIVVGERQMRARRRNAGAQAQVRGGARCPRPNPHAMRGGQFAVVPMPG